MVTWHSCNLTSLRAVYAPWMSDAAGFALSTPGREVLCPRELDMSSISR
jgi:hypothetical protein